MTRSASPTSFIATRSFDKGEIPPALAVSWGKGDPRKDAIYTVFMDEAGHVREHTKFDNLMDPEARADPAT